MALLRAHETRIQAAARQLSPEAPQLAIAEARQKLAYEHLANRLGRRAMLPSDPTYAPAHLRVQVRYLEEEILDLARELEPADAKNAVALAKPIAREHLARDKGIVHPDPAPDLETAQRQLDDVARRLGRLAAAPQPTPQQRVHRILGDLRRLELLDLQHSTASEMRRELVFRGNVVELTAALERVPDPRDLLEKSLADIYRQPDIAREALGRRIEDQGLHAAVEAFDMDPATFGMLRGHHVPGFGDSPERAKARDLAWQRAGEADAAFTRRDRIEPQLEAARYYQGIQNEVRELADAYPSREKFLTELGRHMEGLELHEVRPLLRPGQAKLVQDVRGAEQRFLKPLRVAAREFHSLEAGGVALSTATVQTTAREAAALFRNAPRHILQRLTPPQMQGVLLAAAVAKRALKVLARSVRV
ncbi:MAG: hypothetical protein GY722_19560 [bacterium]|nr:hypothetical protein [bacterium]